MKFAVIGGDDRNVRLCRLLREDGHLVSAFALERAVPDCAKTAAEAVSGAECVILPLPCVRNGWLNAPFAELQRGVKEVLSPIAPGTIVCAGKADDIRAVCSRLGLPLTDYFAREDLAVKNAQLTAEGTISLLLRERGRSLSRSKILICGFGRIGKMLAPRLCAMGALVTVMARSSTDLAWAQGMGCRAVELGVEHGPMEYDVVINTIPATIFGKPELGHFGRAWLIELASPPYGFDMDAAEELGLRLTLASGLPAATTPESAAMIIRDTIYRILEGSN